MSPRKGEGYLALTRKSLCYSKPVTDVDTKNHIYFPNHYLIVLYGISKTSDQIMVGCFVKTFDFDGLEL